MITNISLHFILGQPKNLGWLTLWTQKNITNPSNRLISIFIYHSLFFIFILIFYLVTFFWQAFTLWFDGKRLINMLNLDILFIIRIKGHCWNDKWRCWSCYWMYWKHWSCNFSIWVCSRCMSENLVVFVCVSISAMLLNLND